MKTKTGIELITEERQEQIEKHRRTVLQDVNFNQNNQLVQGAIALIENNGPRGMERNCPKNWDSSIWKKMIRKPYIDRLIIAGALIAAEIDRLNYNVKQEDAANETP